MTDNYEAWTEDEKCGLRISSAVLDRMFTLCKKAGGVETGGILVGNYSNGHRCALVTDCSGAPQDSSAGITHFYRGVKGLKTWMKRLWRRQAKQYYLGEWHYHPKANPTPSGTDLEQLKKIASDASYHCPEPVLFIIGGDSCKGWTHESIVYVHEVGQIQLYLKDTD